MNSWLGKFLGKTLVACFVLSALLDIGSAQKVAETETHMFTSIEHLVTLFKTFKVVTKSLVDYADQYERGNAAVEEFLLNYKKVTEIDEKDQKKFIGNPINAYTLIRMLRTDIEKKLPKIASRKDVVKLVLTDEVLNSADVPTNADYKGAVSAIIRIQNIYGYSADNMIIGKFSSETTSSAFQLDAFDCFIIANQTFASFAHDDQLNSMALSWTRKSIDLLELDKSYLYLKSQRVLKLSKEIEKRMEQYQLVKKEIQDDIGKDGDFKEVSSGHLSNYQKACRQNYSYPPKSFHCRYVNDHPFLLIAPVKEETVYDDPPIWIYHGTLTEKQAEHLRGMALPNLQRATYYQSEKGGYSKIRMSKMYFFEKEGKTDSTLKYLDRLVSAVTKLSMKEAESWQISNYGIGGQFEPHTDQNSLSGHNLAGSGDRFATWLNYLEVPEIGGETVFVALDLKVKVAARSTLFWYNLDKTMRGNPKTMHGGCPVVVGSKWISNKWIHQNDQMFVRPCPLKNWFD